MANKQALERLLKVYDDKFKDDYDKIILELVKNELAKVENKPLNLSEVKQEIGNVIFCSDGAKIEKVLITGYDCGGTIEFDIIIPTHRDAITKSVGCLGYTLPDYNTATLVKQSYILYFDNEYGKGELKFYKHAPIGELNEN